jgi:Cd2+/Zn2+-exporting ATPase
VYEVLDLDCPNCARAVENAVKSCDGVKDAALTYATATLAVTLEPDVDVTQVKKDILSTVRASGEDLKLSDEEVAELGAQRSWYAANREKVLMAISGVGILAGLIFEFGLDLLTFSTACYVIAAAAGLVFVGPMAFAALKRKTADMNVLMGTAVLGALIMGFYELSTGNFDGDVFRDAAIVIFLDQIGEWLEGWSMAKTRGSITSLMELAPDVAHVKRGDAWVDVPAKDVAIGEIVRIGAGERVPLDGVLTEGTSSFDEAPVTGESVPQDKAVGDKVYGGTLNTSAAVQVEVTSTTTTGTLARIIEMVQGAQAQKAPYEAFVDRFAAVYTPIVMWIAIAIGLVVPLFLTVIGVQVDWLDWIWRALTLLVIACPCALVISTPVSFVSGITRAAKQGVLVKGGAYFDLAAKLTAVAFDKTGTLTKGAPAVVGVAASAGYTQECVLELAAALEQVSTHPLARAVVEAVEGDLIEASGVRELSGNGILGEVDGATVRVGKPAFIQAEGIELDNAALAAVEDFTSRAATALVVTVDAQVAGVVGVADVVRETSQEAIAALHKDGIKKTVMLTGDNAKVAAVIGERVGVSDIAAELLPNDKVAKVEELKSQGYQVAMVGDGINDAPALAAADLGITMGAAASDTALEVADVALLSGDLSELDFFVRLARRTMHVVRENIVFAIAVKAAVLVLAAMGIAGMGLAIFADTGVALIVILNGMRLMTKWETKF